MAAGKRDETPRLLIILTDKKDIWKIDKILEAALNKTGKAFAVLPIYIKKEYIKNFLKAARLVFADGMFVMGKYRGEVKYLADVKHADKKIDTVVLKGKKYHGYFVAGEDLVEKLKSKDKEALLAISECIKLWTGRKLSTVSIQKIIEGAEKDK
jgi:hypothetical protein